MTRQEFVTVLTKPGLNILASSACRQCRYLTVRRTCSVWAFPETKWRNGQECLQFDNGSDPEIYGIRPGNIDEP